MAGIDRFKILGLTLLLVGLLSCPVFAQTDPSGEWENRFHEDEPERVPGPRNWRLPWASDQRCGAPQRR